MYINFILFKVYIEKYSKWSNFECKRDNNEYIIDFAFWRVFLY